MFRSFKKNKSVDIEQEDYLSKCIEQFTKQFQSQLEHTVSEIKSNFSKEFVLELKRETESLEKYKIHLLSIIDELKLSIKKSKEEEEILVTNNTTLNSESKSLELKCKGFKHEIEFLDTELKYKKEALQNIVLNYIVCLSKNKKYIELNKKLAEEQEKYIKNLNDLKNSQITHKQDLDKIKEKIKSQKTVVKDYKERITSLENIKKDTERGNKQLERENKLLDRKKADMQLKLAKVLGELEVKKSEELKKDKEVKTLEKQRDLFNEEIKNLDSILKQKYSENEGLNLKKELFITEVEKLESERDLINQQIKEFNMDIISDSYLELRDANMELNEQLNSRKKELDDVNNIFHDITNEVSRLLDQKIILEEIIKNYKLEVLKFEEDSEANIERNSGVITGYNKINNNLEIGCNDEKSNIKTAKIIEMEKVAKSEKNYDNEGMNYKNHITKSNTYNPDTLQKQNNSVEIEEDYIDELLQDFFGNS